MADTVLELIEVSKRFDQTVTADRLSLSIARGEFFTFLGPSGSGKSTVLRMIAGLERPDAGRILIAGEDVVGVPPWRRHLGMVFQQYAVFPHMSVAENVGYALRVRGAAPRGRDARVAALLDLVGLAGMERKNATLLSGGEQQRVALARALAAEPAILLLDEPLSALDEKIRREMQTELKHIQRSTGTTFLYVTHDQEEALTMSDRIAVLNRGSCVQCDAPERIYRRPRTRFVAGFFRGCNVLDAAALQTGPNGERITLAGTAVAAGPLPLPSSNGRIGLAIRSEDLHLGAGAGRFPCTLTARLEEIIYRGTNVDHRLRLADGQLVVATSTRRECDAADAEVMIGFDPEALVILDD
jgi:ABC-type Fe3+/spermidine/putrescine transport system ATPase subunit